MAIVSTVPLEGRDDLSLAYTPGVALVCEAIAARLLKSETMLTNLDGRIMLNIGCRPLSRWRMLEARVAAAAGQIQISSVRRRYRIYVKRVGQQVV